MTEPAREFGSLPDPARAVARATLYEGYVLWPYRRSAPKNQRRWTFGGVHPKSWSEGGHPDDAWRMRAECLLRVPAGAEAPAPATLRVAVRFLQVVERRVALVADEGLEFADQIEVGGVRWTAWDEAREREMALPELRVEPGAEVGAPLEIHAASEPEWLDGPEGCRRGAVVRSWRALRGEARVRCEPAAAADARTYRVSVLVSNTTDWRGQDRQDALRSTFASTHVVLRAGGASFVSLTDPPDELAEAAEACRNEGCWPVLVGERGARDTMLASPIILPDYPVVAPESPGDLFDGGEIDEMLALHILALTDEEKEEMRATDPRTREILDRTTNLGRERILGLHGTFREAETGDPMPSAARHGLAEDAPDPFWVEMGRAPTREVVHDGVALRRGSRVRLHPRPGGDVMDIALTGRTGIIEGIDEDDQGGLQFTVVVEGDPGLDLGMARMPGHRFFFRPDEIEPLGDEAELEPSGNAAAPDAAAPDAAAHDATAPGADPASARNADTAPAADSVALRRILVAGIGNIFLGDDGFGVEVSRRMSGRAVRSGVTVKDYGIRGLDLAYDLCEYDVAIFVDAVPRGEAPGTLYVIDATTERLGPAALQTHGMDPVSVLAFAREIGPLPEEIYVVGCEPAIVPDPEGDVVVGGLSEAVEAAVEGAVAQVEALIAGIDGSGGMKSEETDEETEVETWTGGSGS